MKNCNWNLPALTCLLFASAAVHGQSLISNGGFEEPDVPDGFTITAVAGQPLGPGWMVESATTDAVIIDNGYLPELWFATPSGRQFAYLGDNLGATVLRQDIVTPLEAGSVYGLSFLQSGFRGFGETPGSVRVSVSPTTGAGASVITNFVVPPHAEWRRQTFEFVPSASGLHTIRFASVPDEVANIDDVSLVRIVRPTLSVALYPGIHVRGVIGAAYRVEYTTNLASLPEQFWQPLTNFTLQTSPQFILDRDPAANHPARFYRVRETQ